MDILDACKKMKEGKFITSGSLKKKLSDDYYIYSDVTSKYCDTKIIFNSHAEKAVFSCDDILADDWEVVK